MSRFLAALALPALLLATPASARVTLTAPTIFYVSTSGNDSADCLTSPCATLQHTVNVIQAGYDFAAQPVTIKVANGRYAGFSINQPMTG